MINRLLWWLAQRPCSNRRWLEDIYGEASIRHYERSQKKNRPRPKKRGRFSSSTKEN